MVTLSLNLGSDGRTSPVNCGGVPRPQRNASVCSSAPLVTITTEYYGFMRSVVWKFSQRLYGAAIKVLVHERAVVKPWAPHDSVHNDSHYISSPELIYSGRNGFNRLLYDDRAYWRRVFRPGEKDSEYSENTPGAAVPGIFGGLETSRALGLFHNRRDSKTEIMLGLFFFRGFRPKQFNIQRPRKTFES